eukprot:6466791-Prorocentrum_lima.AAC.1
MFCPYREVLADGDRGWQRDELPVIAVEVRHGRDACGLRWQRRSPSVCDLNAPGWQSARMG